MAGPGDGRMDGGGVSEVSCMSFALLYGQLLSKRGDVPVDDEEGERYGRPSGLRQVQQV